MTESANNTVVLGSTGAITDAAGNVWSIDGAGQVAINGVGDPTTAGVAELAYVNGLVWQEAKMGLWWSKASPADPWQPPLGTTTNPTLPIQFSFDGTVIGASTTGPVAAITDADGNTWRIADGQVVVNGTIDASTLNVTELAYENGRVWQQNADGMWWSKGGPGDSWDPPLGTPANPVTGTFYIGNQAGNQAVISIGTLTASIGAAAAPLSTAQIITPGVEAAGSTILISTEVSTLVIDGDSSISQGATLETLGAYRAPRPLWGPVENNGTMTVSDSTANIGTLSGTGAIVAVDGGSLNIQSAAGGNTIELHASNLDIGGQGGGPGSLGTPGGMTFLAPVTLDESSSITLNATQATAEIIHRFAGSVSEVLLFNGAAEVADLHIGGASAIYASDDATAGSVTLTATDSGHSLPIVDGGACGLVHGNWVAASH
jgi:hypothetical protein